MIRVGSYIENRPVAGADVSRPEFGNPGIGGSTFTAIAQAYYLKKLFPDQVDPVLLVNSTDLLPKTLEIHQADTCVAAAELCADLNIDILVYKARSDEVGFELYDTLERLGLPAVARSNNTPTARSLRRMYACPAVKRHVCVSQEQMDRLRDHAVIEKTVRIFNVFNGREFKPSKPIEKRGDSVAYVGSLIPAKGFHLLAEAWPHVVKRVPEAKLTVIGSGKLYDRSKALGRWGVAEETYEARIRPHLSDERGDVMSSVHFAGLLGKEKIPILQNADVGVANPTGVSENCPASAIEIQACGTPIASAAEWGLLDTVSPGKTGLLGRGRRQLVDNIVYLLTHRREAAEMGRTGIEFIESKFAPEIITPQWLSLFKDILAEKPVRVPGIQQYPLYKGKIIRETRRYIKSALPILKLTPSLSDIREWLGSIKRRILRKK